MKNKILEILEKYKTILYDSSHKGEIIRGIQPDDFDKIVNEIIMVIEPKMLCMGKSKTVEDCIRENCNIEYTKYSGEEVVHSLLSTVCVALEEYTNQQSITPTLTKEIMFSFIDWLYSAHYSKYWGSDEPNNGKWYKGYTNPDRQYFTLKELFTMAIETKK